jgi:hypothetical protein
MIYINSVNQQAQNDMTDEVFYKNRYFDLRDIKASSKKHYSSFGFFENRINYQRFPLSNSNFHNKLFENSSWIYLLKLFFWSVVGLFKIIFNEIVYNNFYDPKFEKNEVVNSLIRPNIVAEQLFFTSLYRLIFKSNYRTAYDLYFFLETKVYIHPNPYFCPRWYLKVNPDLKNQSLSPLNHFFFFGYSEGRDHSPDFKLEDKDIDTLVLDKEYPALNYSLCMGNKIRGYDSEEIVFTYEKYNPCLDRELIKKEELPALVDFYDTISFDFWGTLFLRRLPDNSAKYVTSVNLWKIINLKSKNFSNSKNIFIDFKESVVELLKLRIILESSISEQNDHEEYHVKEVLYHLCNKHQDHKNLAIDVEKLMNKELLLERKLLIPNRLLISLFNSAKSQGKNPKILSDFYFDREMMFALTFDSLPLAVIDDFIVSVDVKSSKRKDFGIYNKVHSMENSGIHFGDNFYSDISQCLLSNNHAVHVRQSKNPDEDIVDNLANLDWILNFYRNDLKNRLDYSQSTTILDRHLLDEDLEFFIINNYLIMRLINLVSLVCANGSYKKVFLLGHEGLYLKDFFLKNLNHPDTILNELQPQISHLEVSRKSLFPVAFASDYATAIKIYTATYNPSFNKLMEDLGLNPKDFNSEVNLNENVCNHSGKALVPRWDIIQEIYDFYSVELHQIKYSFLEFSKSNELSSDPDLLVVDIGWKGSIQDYLKVIFPDKNIVGVYLNLIESDNQIDNTKLSTMTPVTKDNFHWFSPGILENFWSIDSDSVLGYTSSGAAVKHKGRDVYGLSNRCQTFSLVLLEKMLETSSLWGFIDFVHNDSVLSKLKSIMANPPGIAGDLWAMAHFNDIFGSGNMLINPLEFAHVLDEISHNSFSSKVNYGYKYTQSYMEKFKTSNLIYNLSPVRELRMIEDAYASHLTKCNKESF